MRIITKSVRNAQKDSKNDRMSREKMMRDARIRRIRAARQKARDAENEEKEVKKDNEVESFVKALIEAGVTPEEIIATYKKDDKEELPEDEDVEKDDEEIDEDSEIYGEDEELEEVHTQDSLKSVGSLARKSTKDSLSDEEAENAAWRKRLGGNN